MGAGITQPSWSCPCLGSWSQGEQRPGWYLRVTDDKTNLNSTFLVPFLKWLWSAAAAAVSLQSFLTLCDPIDGSPPGSTVPGILRARPLEWVAISFSNAGKWKVKVKSRSRVRLFTTPWTAAHQTPPSMGFSRQEDWSGVPLPSPSSCSLFLSLNAHEICIFTFKSCFHQARLRELLLLVTKYNMLLLNIVFYILPWIFFLTYLLLFNLQFLLNPVGYYCFY